jgi:hypothetical protein
MSNLCREAHYLYQQCFQRRASSSLVERYKNAHAEIPELNRADAQETRTMYLIMEKKLNAPGIEPWLRNEKKHHILTSKLLLIMYLAECDAAHREFTRASSGRFLGWVSMFSACWRGVMRLCIGAMQKNRYGLL